MLAKITIEMFNDDEFIAFGVIQIASSGTAVVLRS